MISAGEWRDAGRGHIHTLILLAQTTQHTLGAKRRTKVRGALVICCAFFSLSVIGRRKKKFPKGEEEERSVAPCVHLKRVAFFGNNSSVWSFFFHLTRLALGFCGDLLFAGFPVAQKDNRALR